MSFSLRVSIHCLIAAVFILMLIVVILKIKRLRYLSRQKPVEENKLDRKERDRKIVIQVSNHDNH